MTACQLSESCPFRDNHVPPCLPAPRPELDPDDALPVRRCKCSHLRAGHYRDRRGETVCSSAVCGCAEFRPREDRPAGDAA